MQRWLPGRIHGRAAMAAARAARPVDAELARAARAYLAARAPLFGTGRCADPEGMLRLLEENAREGLAIRAHGPVAPLERALGRALARVCALPSREARVPDAGLQPREWVRGPHGARRGTRDGWAKVDAIDHGDGLRWPGPTDSAWDLAGVALELELDDAAVAELVAACAASAGEAPPELAAAVRAYRPVYAACALGDAALSPREACTERDRLRLDAEAAWYAARLRRELAAAA